MKDEINKYLEIKSPLVKLNEDQDKIDISFEDKKIIVAILYRDEINTIEFNFFQKFKLFTPALTAFNNYSIDFSKVLLKINETEDFKYIIFNIYDYFLVFSLSYDNDFQIIKEGTDQQKLSIKFSTDQYFKINIKKFTDLREFYTAINKDLNLLPLWLNNPGLMIDLNDITHEDIKFSDIKADIKNNEIYLILKNWISYSNIFKNSRNEFNFDDFIQKVIFNNIRYILQYDNSIPKEKSLDLPVLKIRNGELYLDKNMVMIDYFNRQGEEKLINFYNEILNNSTSGLYLFPVYYYLSNKEALDKVIIKNEYEISVYSKNVKNGLKKINKIIEEVKRNIYDKDDYVFVTNVLSKSLDSTIYIKEVSYVLEEEIIVFENLYKQGFINFGIFLKLKDVAFSKKDLIKILIIIFSVPFYILDINLIFYFKKNPIYKEILVNLLQVRLSLNSLYDNILFDFKKYGIIPIKAVFKAASFKGFFIGNYLYCAIINEGLLNYGLYLPEGNWYNPEDNIIVKGGSNFFYKGEKKNYYLLQKKNSIVIYNFSSEHNRFLKNKKIKFIIFITDDILLKGKITKKILERIIIDKRTFEIFHNFEFKKNKNKIIMKYFSNENYNIGRHIYFTYVIDQKEVDWINCNNKKVVFSRKDCTVEFNSINKENKLEYEINF